MATDSDFKAIATLCAAAKDEAQSRFDAMPPCPADPAAAAAWRDLNARLRKSVDTLTNVDAQLAAAAITQALQDSWPQLQGVTAVTTRAKADIKQIADLSKALSTLGAIVDLGVAVAALAAVPSIGGAQAVVTAFKNLKPA